MPDTLLNFLPVVSEDADSVRARFDADVNAGIDPNDPAFLDTTEGGFYWDLTQACVLECVRLWDFLGTELPAASFPGTAWGDYLDMHGETVNLPRDDEVAATGIVMFTGDAGTLIPAGSQVSTQQADPSESTLPVVFNTDRSITLAAVPGPVNLAAVLTPTGGSLSAGVYYYAVTAVGPSGETIASNEATVSVTGTTSRVDLSWATYAGATAYKVYRGIASGAETLLATLGTVLVYSDTGAQALGTLPVPTNTVSITAADAGSVGNVPSGSISLLLSPIAGAPQVSNTQPTSGGADVESDDRYRLRILAEYGKSVGAGNVSDYVKWALQIPQVGYATVQPIWQGAGTVRVIITDQSNRPNSPSIVAQLQAQLDPVPGQGQGQAPIGASVVVATPTLLTVNVTAVMVYESGYSLDGATGTVPVRSAVTAAVTSYLSTLTPGQYAIWNAVMRQIMAVPGVHDVTSLLLNGATGNVTVGALQVVQSGTVTLT